MKITRRLIWIIASMSLAVILVMAWWRTAGFRVDPGSLDYLRASAHPAGIMIVGAWDAPGGAVLDRATFRRDAAGCTVSLHGRPLVNRRGETTRLFRVLVPTGATQRPGSVRIAGPAGIVSLDVQATRMATGPRPVVEMEAVAE